MTVLYADRGFISINGARMEDVQSITVRQNDNAKPVPSMTPNRRNRGYTKGNRDFEITFVSAVRNQQARPKLESIDYENNSVQLTAQFGADIFTITGLFYKDSEDAAGGVGDEVKTTWNFSALDLVDNVGNSALFGLDLT